MLGWNSWQSQSYHILCWLLLWNSEWGDINRLGWWWCRLDILPMHLHANLCLDARNEGNDETDETSPVGARYARRRTILCTAPKSNHASKEIFCHDFVWRKQSGRPCQFLWQIFSYPFNLGLQLPLQLHVWTTKATRRDHNRYARFGNHCRWGWKAWNRPYYAMDCLHCGTLWEPVVVFYFIYLVQDA